MTERRYTFEPLGKQHDRAAFACGEDALDRYFREQARQQMEKRVAAVFVYHDTDEQRVVGYYTLSTLSMHSASLPTEIARKLPRYQELPATLLGRLAVVVRYRNRGFGKRLLLDALWRAHDQTKIATLAVVDAKNDAAHAFYRHYGFLPLPETASRLIMPMGTIARLFPHTEN